MGKVGIYIGAIGGIGAAIAFSLPLLKVIDGLPGILLAAFLTAAAGFLGMTLGAKLPI